MAKKSFSTLAPGVNTATKYLPLYLTRGHTDEGAKWKEHKVERHTERETQKPPPVFGSKEGQESVWPEKIANCL